MAVTRNSGAKWFLPSANEWYKAAYHQPASEGGDTDDYWSSPMRTNSIPYSDEPPGQTPDNTRVANFYRDDGVANGYDDGRAVNSSPDWLPDQNYLTDVGAYSSSPSFYGTFDQGGNVEEWSDTVSRVRSRITRGGWWSGPTAYLMSG
jgi:formylglycine-generating enzyme